jgi:site-specific DNA-methyltransferase (adenine-specific)
MKAKTGNGKPVKSHKVKSNLWAYPATKITGAGNHPAAFPEQLALDQIASWSNEGDIVLDIFCGSGTTCKAAKQLERHYLGFEISQDYCAIAEKRLLFL